MQTCHAIIEINTLKAEQLIYKLLNITSLYATAF